jgi:enoyl-[acyl-carrier protein] reductase III
VSRNLIITGASRGIGRAIALKLAEAGDRVAVNFRGNEAAAEETAELLRAKGAEPLLVQANVRNKKDCERLAATFDQVDLLVNNAAIGALKPFDKIRFNQWDLTLESSLRPMWYLSAITHFAEGANVIGISSLGSRSFIPGYAAMGAAKAGLEALTRQLAVELAPKNIRVNTVCGGLIETDTLQYFPEAMKPLIEHAKAYTPLGGIGQAEDMANAVWLLTRPEARWITGQVVVVDGGLSLL